MPEPISFPEPRDEAQRELNAVSCRLHERFLQDFMAEFDRRVTACIAGGSTPEQAGACVLAQLEDFRREQKAAMCDALLSAEADILARLGVEE